MKTGVKKPTLKYYNRHFRLSRIPQMATAELVQYYMSVFSDHGPPQRERERERERMNGCQIA